MKKTLRVLLLTLLTATCLCAFAAAADLPAGMTIKTLVTESTHAGENGLAVDVNVTSGAKETAMLSLCLTYDKTMLELVDGSGNGVALPETGTVNNAAQLVGYPDFEINNDLYVVSLGEKLGGVCFVRISLANTFDLQDECVGRIFLKLKDGADAKKAAESIRLSTHEEAVKLRQSCTVYYMDSDLNYYVLNSKGDAAETPALEERVKITANVESVPEEPKPEEPKPEEPDVLPKDMQLEVEVTNGTHAGKNGLAVGLNVTSGAKETAMLSLCLTYDKTMLELVDGSGNGVALPETGTVNNAAQLAGYPDFEINNDLYVVSLGEKLGGVCFVRISLANTFDLQDECVGRIFLKLKDGADAKKAAESIRLSTHEEAVKLRQSSTVYYMDSDLNYYVLNSKGDAAETPALEERVKITANVESVPVDPVPGVADVLMELKVSNGTHAGRNGLAVGLDVTSGAKKTAMLSLALVYDRTMLELVDAAGNPLELPAQRAGLLNSAQLVDYPAFELSNDLYAITLGDRLAGLAFSRVSLTDAFLLQEECVGKVFLALKAGADLETAAESIRLSTYEEASKLTQSSAVYYMNGELNYYLLNSKGGTEDTPGFENNVKISVSLKQPEVPAGVTVEGQILNSHRGGAAMTLSGTEVYTASLVGGEYVFGGVKPGTYTLTVEERGYLAYVVKEISVGSGDITLAPITLLAGDVNGDKMINIIDMSVFRNNFGKKGDAVMEPLTDTNGDNMVNIIDMSVFRSNFGKTTVRHCTVVYEA